MHPVGKLCVGSKNDYHLFNGLDVLYHHAKFGEDVLRAPAVGAKIWCLFIFSSVCHAPSSVRCLFDSDIL